MPVDSIHSRIAPLAIKDLPATTELKMDLISQFYNITENIDRITNSIAVLDRDIKEINKSINADGLFLERIKPISIAYGGDAIVRLKHGEFKCDKGGNFVKNILFTNRYQRERTAATNQLSARGDTISASTSEAVLKKRIDSGNHKLEPLRLDLCTFSASLRELEKNKSDIMRQMNVVFKEDIKEIESKKAKIREIFSTIYQSDAGRKTSNNVLFIQYINASECGKADKLVSLEGLDGKKVVAEYEMALGRDVFHEENKGVKVAIKEYCKELPWLVNTAADLLYTPTSKNITTYHAQRMSTSGINTLLEQSEDDRRNRTTTVYEPGYFFSTYPSSTDACKFAKNFDPNFQVVFEVKGNSSNGLTVPNGLAFGSHKDERVYSPHANFKVIDVYMVSMPYLYHVLLEEVPRVDNPQRLPG